MPLRSALVLVRGTPGAGADGTVTATRRTAKPSAPVARHLHFIRHGEYSFRPGTFDGPLTALGRRQARRAARRLAQWPISVVHTSDLERAVESADIIMQRLGDVPRRVTRTLREIAPTATERVELVFERFFRPSRSTRHEVIVCHGTLIRTLVCRVQRAPPTHWLTMATSNCGITRFVVWADGSVTTLTYNDIGHLPPDLVTSVI